MDHLKYPIGKFAFPEICSDSDLKQWIAEIAEAPSLYRKMFESMTSEQLETAYRPGGWTGRQVIHHVSDSHLQAYGRFKLVLTEESPTIKPYHEDRWANLADTFETPVKISVDLLQALHYRWVKLLDSMKKSDFDLYYIHPEYGKKYSLGAVCKLYAWHGKHHLAHLNLIKNLNRA